MTQFRRQTARRSLRRWVAVGAAGVTALATAVFPTSAVQAAPAAPEAPAAAIDVAAPATSTSHPSGEGARADAKGPIGWDTYRRLDRIDELTSGVETHQFSSFDRAGGNDDGFAGTYSCLRTIAEGCVLAERSGAGEIESIWFTRDEGDVTRTGSIRIELDGKTVLDAPVQDLVDGKAGAPFVHPMVANADQSSGGVYVKVPMPYTTSMRITTSVNPLFYHVTYRTFADALGVKTFDPTDQALDVIQAAETWGKTDPKPAVKGAKTVTDTFSLKPGKSVTLAQLRGAGEISALKLKVPQIIGPKKLPLISDDGRAHRGTSTFTVEIDPANQGVTLQRRFDATSAQQVADITVDGRPAGRWAATDDTAGHWSYQSVTLPASLTAGKSSITVANTFVSATIDWNEFHYWVDSVVAGADKRTDELDVGASAASMASEQAHDYVITGQTWTGTPNLSDESGPIDPKVSASNALLRDVMVRVSFDGRKTVESPLGEFFGSGLTEAPVSALFYSMSTAAGGWYSSWWPMPFASKATVELVNNSKQTITSGSSSVTSHTDKAIGTELRREDARIGYFNATHRRADTVTGQDWIFLDTAGRGRFVGVSHTMKGHIESGNIRDYLEGDERVYVDGSRTPSIHGTGTEDFYGAGWYFNRGAFSNPMNGLSAMPTKTNGCEFQCDSPYRLMIGDAVSFRSGLTFSIEHGPTANDPAEYSSTAYWYGAAEPAARVTDTIDVGDARSEKAHRYTGSGAAQTITATFEGDHDTEPVTEDVASATGRVSFTVQIDRDNVGVALRRMSLQTKGYQAAAVTINGSAAGTWQQPLANTTHRWLEDSFQVPPALTRGQRSLTVTLSPTADSPAWSAASYQALSHGDAERDRKRPSTTAGLVATGTDSNAIRLAWSSATDDVAVHGYQIYGSRRASFRPNAKSLIGTSTLASFEHTGLGLDETWYYRVRAVDSSGNAGRLPLPVSATTGPGLRIEVENLLPAVSADAPVEAQGNCCGVNWSAGRQLWFRAAKANDAVTLTFTVPETGTYDASSVMTRAADYGIVAVSVDGKPVGDPINNYIATGVTVATRSLGALELTAGEHRLTLTATGKDVAATGFFIGADVLDLTLQGGNAARVTSYSSTATVVEGGPRQRIYDPSVGEVVPFYVNDHTFVRGPDGKWNLFGITHQEPAAPLEEDYFAHATADSLTQAQYVKQPGVIQAELSLGEKHVWAPYVLQDGGTYYLYYSAGLDDNHETFQMRLATSTDLKTWTKRQQPLFTDGFDARDPMVLRVGNQWVMYYTANSTPSGGQHQVAYRTSADLVTWSTKEVAFTHPVSGTFGGPTESPFVVAKDGWYYLFVCGDSGYTDTRVYRSRDPLKFDIGQLTGQIDEHAAEVFQDADGSWYISGAGWGAGGVYLRPLNFSGSRVTAGKMVRTSNYRMNVQTSPTTSITSMEVADGSGRWRSVLDADYRGTSPYLAVGNFGDTDVAGAAGTVRTDGNRLTLSDIPMGDEPVTADWTLNFGAASFDSSVTATVTGPTTAPLWEVAMTFDGAGARTGDDVDSARSRGDIPGFSAWSQSTGADASVAAAYRAGSADGTDNRFVAGSGAVIWQPLWQPGGRALPPGTFDLGTWTVGASPIGGDDTLGARLGG